VSTPTQTAQENWATPAYWDHIVAQRGRKHAIAPWRDYMSRIYRALLHCWVDSPQSGGGLKTDLFEEAISDYNVLAFMGPGSIGIDCSVAAAACAKRRMQSAGRESLYIVGDLRSLPIRDGAVRYVLSGSSLDHFLTEDHIALGLGELHRVLAPGGTAVITMDNPHNPVVWLRNRLPFHWLSRIGLLPYFVGVTTTRNRMCQMLRAQGFDVGRVSAVVHAPRAVCIGLIELQEDLRWFALDKPIARLLEAFEFLERLPTRWFTGYYLAFQACKPTSQPATNSKAPQPI
jgi:SAM-dependent methyltransferase